MDVIACNTQINHRSRQHSRHMQLRTVTVQAPSGEKEEECILAETKWSSLHPVQAIITTPAPMPIHRQWVRVAADTSEHGTGGPVDLDAEISNAHTLALHVKFPVNVPQRGNKPGTHKLAINTFLPQSATIMAAVMIRMQNMTTSTVRLREEAHVTPLVQDEITYAAKQCERAKRIYTESLHHRPCAALYQRMLHQMRTPPTELQNREIATQWLDTRCHERPFHRTTSRRSSCQSSQSSCSAPGIQTGGDSEQERVNSELQWNKLALTVFSGILPVTPDWMAVTVTLKSMLSDVSISEVSDQVVGVGARVHLCQDGTDAIAQYARYTHPAVVVLQCAFGATLLSVEWRTHRIPATCKRVSLKQAMVQFPSADAVIRLMLMIHGDQLSHG